MQIDIDIVASPRGSRNKNPHAVIDISTKALGNKSLRRGSRDGFLDRPAITISPPDGEHEISEEINLKDKKSSSSLIEKEYVLTKEDKQRSSDGRASPIPLPAPAPAPDYDTDTSSKKTKNSLPKAEEETEGRRKKDAPSPNPDPTRKGRSKSHKDQPKPKQKMTMHWFALVWILAFLLTAALAIAALAHDEWATLEYTPTDNEYSFGLWYTYESRMPSCNSSDIVRVTMEAEYSEFRLKLVIAFLIVGIILDGVSLFLGIFVWLARLKGQERHWAWSIPTIIAVLLAGDFILAGCAVYIWDLDHVPYRSKAVENSNCSTFLLYVYIRAHGESSLFLALASACCCLVKALIFGLVAHKIRSAQSKQLKEDKLQDTPRRSKSSREES